jgi:cbb3-type cytochrome oxidase subunit 3
MIQDALRSIGGIGLYGVVSIGLFLVVFVGMLVWVFRLKKYHLNSMAALPLENDPETGAPSAPILKSDRSHE